MKSTHVDPLISYANGLQAERQEVCQLVYRVPVFCSIFYTPDPDHLADRRTSPTTIQLYQPYYLAILEYNYVF